MWRVITGSFSKTSFQVANSKINFFNKYYKEDRSQLNNYVNVSCFLNQSQEELRQILVSFENYKLWHKNLNSVEEDKKGIRLTINTTSNTPNKNGNKGMINKT